MLVLFAMVLALLLGMVGFLYSFGLAVVQRRADQTAADASSLRGAWQVLQELQSGNRSDSAVRDAILTYVAANGIPSDGTPANATYVDAAYVAETGEDLLPAAPVGGGGTFPSTARGVRVTARNTLGTLLPGFIGGISQVTTAATGAAALVATASPSSATLVLPVAVAVDDFTAAFSAGALYDLFAPATAPPGGTPTLDFLSPSTSPAPGAADYGSLSRNLQYWSDGQHENGTLALGASVALADALYANPLAVGISDNVTRQALTDSSGAAYALVVVPLWDTSTAGTVRVAGFALMKLRGADVGPTAARGTFVPYAAGAWGVASPPSTDVGARFVRLVP